MKNLFYLIFALVLMSCENDNIEIDDLNTLNQITKDFAVEKEKTFARFDLLESGDIVLSTNTDKKEFSDGIYKEVILLGGRTNSLPIQELLGEVYLVTLNNIIIIQKGPSEFLNLIVNADEISYELSKLKEYNDIKIDDNNSYVGYGLSKLRGEWTFPEDISKHYKNGIEALHYYNIIQATKHIPYSKTTCNAGGPGSTSCTVSEEYFGVKQSCSVTCGAGYYACCNNISFPICSCEKGRGGSDCTTVNCILPF